MCNSLLGRSKARKAEEKKAQFDMDSAKREAADNGEAIRGNQLARETTIAQAAAAESARALLDRPAEEVEVDLAPADPAEKDPVTGRRRPTRAAFMSAGAGSAGLRV